MPLLRRQDIKSGPHRRYENLVYYACQGVVIVEDESDGSHRIVSPFDFKERARALQAMLTKAPSTAHVTERDLHRKAHDAIDDMLRCADEALEQGSPFDQRFSEWFTLHRPLRGKRVSMAGSGRDYVPALPGKLPTGRFTGRVAPGPDVSCGVPVHQTPRRRLIRTV